MKKKRRNILLSILIGTFLLCTVAGNIFYYYLFALQFHPSKTVYIYVDRDDTADSVYHKIKEFRHVNKLTGSQWMAEYKDFSQNIHTGRYAIRPNDNIYHVYSHSSRGYQEPMNPTIGSARTSDRLARSVGKQFMIDSAGTASQLFDSTLQAQMGYTNVAFPSFFTPETYQVYLDTNVDESFKRMKDEHKRFWNEDRLAQVTATGMTPEEVSTLASIIEEKTNDNEEESIIAGLYIDRSHRDMPLQANPTIKSALQDFSLRRITNEHLKANSPCDTYINTGLPPGPIHTPSKKGIDSVLNCTKHNYVYMCAKGDFSDTHNFTSNYASYIVSARKYWKALSERRAFK